MQVYRYYRDLINFKQKGDPALMLKCINPAEATFLDSAAGIHIKYRLAGVRKHKRKYMYMYIVNVHVHVHVCFCVFTMHVP